GNGAVISSFSAKGGFIGATGPPFKVSSAGAIIVGIESVLSLALAIYLLVAGILTLRQSLRGRQLHLIYAIIKIPLVIVAMIGTYLLFSSLYRTMTAL